MRIRKSGFIVPLLTFAFHCTPSHAVASTSIPIVLFSDNYSESDISNAGVISGLDSTVVGRFGGELAGTVHYMFTNGTDDGLDVDVVDGNFMNSALRIQGGVLDFSGGQPLRSGQGQIDNRPDVGGISLGNRGIRFQSSGSEYNWKDKLGRHYGISFRWASGFNNPFSFSISDEPEPGDSHAGKEGPYDFGVYAHGHNWHVGRDGIKAQYTVDRPGRADRIYDFSVTINEDAYSATVVIKRVDTGSGSEVFTEVLNQTYTDLDFDNSTNRYFQFYAEGLYAGMLDDLEIITYAVPELSNCALLTALLLLARLFVTRRYSHL